MIYSAFVGEINAVAWRCLPHSLTGNRKLGLLGDTYTGVQKAKSQ